MSKPEYETVWMLKCELNMDTDIQRFYKDKERLVRFIRLCRYHDILVRKIKIKTVRRKIILIPHYHYRTFSGKFITEEPIPRHEKKEIKNENVIRNCMKRIMASTKAMNKNHREAMEKLIGKKP